MPARLPPDGPLSLLPPRPAKPRASPQRLRGRNWRQTCQKIWPTDWQQAGQDAGKRSGSLRHPGGIFRQGGWSGSAVWLPLGPFPWVPSGDLPAAGQKPPRHGLRGSGLPLARCPAPDLACGQASIKDAFAVLAPFFTHIFLQPAPCPRPGERLCPARHSRPRHAKAPFRRADSRRRKGAEGESGLSESPEAVPRRWTGAPKGTERTRPLCRS